MEREDHTVVNVLVIENVEIVPDVQTERECVGKCFHLDCICVCIVLSACIDDVLVEKLRKMCC